MAGELIRDWNGWRRRREGKSNSPLVCLEHSIFLINRSSCLRLEKRLKEQKLKLSYLYFIPKSLPVCLWGHFSYCPHSLEMHRTILEQEEVARTRHELAIFFSALGRQMILENGHFFQESCALKSAAWPEKLSQSLDDPSYRSRNPFSSGHSRRVTVVLLRNHVQKKCFGKSYVWNQAADPGSESSKIAHNSCRALSG